MIKNDRQYRITRAAAARFEDALRRLESEGECPTDPMIEQAERDAVRSELDELNAQLKEYDDLASGRVGVLELRSLADLPQALVQARIASGMSQRDLADRLGLKEQQVQRYEATDYQKASLGRLLEVAEALKLQVRKDLLLSNATRTPTSLFSRLRELGLPRDFVLSRLVPHDAVTALTENRSGAFDRFRFAATCAASHIFGWTPAAVLGEGRPWLDSGVLGAVRFKVSTNAETKTLEVYTFYAHFLGLLLLKATDTLPVRPIPTDPHQVHREIVDRFGTVSFNSALLYCWDLGVPVLPLNDPGAFHGACWRVDHRNVIVLKQRTHSLARWLFDLLHELRHAAEEPSQPTFSVVESPDAGLDSDDNDAEREASWFAGEVCLGGRGDELASLCVERSSGHIERLKAVVPAVAADAGVDTASLANYMAFRLSVQGENWWGAAANLQPRDERPWSVARNVLLQRTNLSRLRGLDYTLFVQGLFEPET